MVYKVTQKSARGPEVPVGRYQKIAEAEIVIQKKLEEDALYKLSNKYYLYEGMDMDPYKEYDQSNREIKPEEEGSSQQSGNAQSFRPSPFSTSPQPKGMPKSWVQDDSKKDDEK